MTPRERAFYTTVDPTVDGLSGKGSMPAGTTLLFRVCGNDPDKFAEATRLVDLFMAEAVRLTAMDGVLACRIEDWHEDIGNVVWWVKPGYDGEAPGVGPGEPPYVGTPLDNDWPGYHQWWTPLQPYPAVWAPAPPEPKRPEFDVWDEGYVVVMAHRPSGEQTCKLANRFMTLADWEDWTRQAMAKLRGRAAAKEAMKNATTQALAVAALGEAS